MLAHCPLDGKLALDRRLDLTFCTKASHSGIARQNSAHQIKQKIKPHSVGAINTLARLTKHQDA
jgi:hypothetical protein